jgi:hypothetical protein
MALGIFGALFSYQHYERNRRHAKQAREYRKKLEEHTKSDPKTPQIDLKQIRDDARHKHNENFCQCWTKTKQLYKFWIAVNIFIIVLGAILTGTIIYEWLSSSYSTGYMT